MLPRKSFDLPSPDLENVDSSSSGSGTAGAIDWTWIYDHPSRVSSALFAKRLVDLTLSSLLLVLSAPILLGAALLIRLTSRGRVLFVQPRIGFACRRFTMYKLRTMFDGAEAMEETLASKRPSRSFFKIENDPRMTRLGRFLRKYSIDELPQLVNVLRGQMSLVGPRPLLLSDFEKFPKDKQMRRFSMKPGLTGLWQVSGRSLCTDRQRIRLDLEYVDRWSLWLDLVVLARTVSAVLSGQGAT